MTTCSAHKLICAQTHCPTPRHARGLRRATTVTPSGSQRKDLALPKKAATKRSVAAIILHFGDAADTQRCVESVVTAKRAAAGHCSTTIHVVSNGSASQPQFRAEIRSEVSVSSLEKNCGFAAGMNAGIRSAMADEPDYFWLLNNDTLVDSQSLCELVKHAAGHPGLKWLGPSIVDAKNDQIISYGGYLYCDALSVALPVKKHGNSADYLDGAAMFLCAKALKEIYLIPEKSFLYFEELHLARAFAERGYSWGTCETAFVTHIGGSSTATLGARKNLLFNLRRIGIHVGIQLHIHPVSAICQVDQGNSRLRDYIHSRPPARLWLCDHLILLR